MKRKSLDQATQICTLICMMLAVVGIAQYEGVGSKIATLLAGIGIIRLLLTRDLDRLRNFPALMLFGYVLFSMLTALWAFSGKFFLREYSKVFVATFFFLLISTHRKLDRKYVRHIMGIIVGISALYAFLSVEASAIGGMRAMLQNMGYSAAASMGFDGRLTGVFGNSNIEASFYAIGILFSISLLCGAESKWRHGLWATTLSFCMYAFLLVISLGAAACLAAAIVIYFLFASKNLGAALLRMLETAVPNLFCAFLAPSFFDASGKEFLPLLLMLMSAVITAALELLIGQRLSLKLEQYQKFAFCTMIAVLALFLTYAFAGYYLTDEYEFGTVLSRRAELEAGPHTLEIAADSDISVTVYSRDIAQTLTYDLTMLYYGTDKEIAFEVPENAALCYFDFVADQGSTLYAAIIDGSRELPLHYRLFPEFIAGRLQNLAASNSQYQRETYVRDALKFFRQRPILGHGVGAFESAVTSVQDYHYETKYVHNHYAQILVEGGIIGFALFVGSLIAMAVALWKKRKVMMEGEYRWIYPALCAEFVMNGLQMLWDVSMSVTAFLCMTYATYGLIVGLCAEPIGQKVVQAELEAPKKKKKQAPKQDNTTMIRIACITLPALFMLTVCLNLYANHLTHKESKSFDDFETAVKIDLYEHNDWKLSYVLGAQSEGTGEHIAQANAYAEQLSKVQSNTIPRYLTAYYLNTQQYEKAIDEAMLGATYSASDAEVWNGTILSLKMMLLDIGPASPLLTQGDVLLPKLMEYHAMLERYNETALMPIALNENSQTFFDKVLRLNDCEGDTEAMLAILLEVPAA